MDMFSLPRLHSSYDDYDKYIILTVTQSLELPHRFRKDILVTFSCMMNDGELVPVASSGSFCSSCQSHYMLLTDYTFIGKNNFGV
jgi:hypothetical protein